MQKIAPSSGWFWLQQGFALFRQQPMLLSGLYALNLLLLILISNIPLLGHVLPLVLMPACNMALMSACLHIARGEKVDFGVWSSGFRAKAFPVLCQLGLAYALANWGAIALSSLVDNGLFLQLASGKMQLDPNSKTMPNIGPGMLTTLACMIPAVMAVWFASPLIMWKNMPLLKAMFFSFFAVWHALLAFLVFVMSVLACATGMLIFSAVITLATHSQGFGVMLLMPMIMMLSTVLYCSVYPAYVQIFGAQDAPGSVP